VCWRHLAVGILQQVAQAPVQHARPTGRERGAVPVAAQPLARRLHPDELDVRVIEERRKDTDRVGATAHTGHDTARQAAVRASICARASRPMTA